MVIPPLHVEPAHLLEGTFLLSSCSTWYLYHSPGTFIIFVMDRLYSDLSWFSLNSVHTLVWSPLPECEQNLLLINGIWQRGWAGTSRTALHEWDASLLTLSLLRFSLLDWRCEWLCSQQAASSLQPTGSRGPQSCSCRKINSANCLNELGSGFFPSRVSRGEPSPVDTLIATSWDPKQRTQTSDPQKLWGNRYHRNYDIMNTDQWIVPLCINYLHHFFGWVITVTQPTSISLVWCIKWNYFLKWDY